MAMTMDEVFAGIRDSIENARPDVKRERADLLKELMHAIEGRELEKTMAVLERLDIVDHYPAIRRPDGTLEPQPMPGGWTSWYGWMKRLKAVEETPYLRRARAAATPDIPEEQIKKRLW
jgi:hypothetical protein